MIRNWIVLVLLSLLFLLPLTILFLYSAAGIWKYPEILPGTFNPRAFHFLISRAGAIFKSLASSTFYSLCTVLLSFIICVIPSMVFAREDFPFKNILSALLLAPALVPSITFSMGIHFLFIVAGLSDTMFGVILILTIYSYPYMLRALIAGFKAYGPEYGICAENLGAGLMERIFKIDLPLILPSFISGGTVVFLAAFSNYFLVFLIGGGAVPSFTGYLFPLLNSSDRPVASLLTILFFIVPLGLFGVIDFTVNRIHRKRGMI